MGNLTVDRDIDPVNICLEGNHYSFLSTRRRLRMGFYYVFGRGNKGLYYFMVVHFNHPGTYLLSYAISCR